MRLHLFARCVIAGVIVAGTSWAAAQVTEPAEATSQPTKEAPINGPRLELSSTEFNFGDVWEGQPVKGEFSVKNTGTEKLTLRVKSA